MLRNYDGNAIDARAAGELRIVPMSLSVPATPGALIERGPEELFREALEAVRNCR